MILLGITVTAGSFHTTFRSKMAVVQNVQS